MDILVDPAKNIILDVRTIYWLWFDLWRSDRSMGFGIDFTRAPWTGFTIAPVHPESLMGKLLSVKTSNITGKQKNGL